MDSPEQRKIRAFLNGAAVLGGTLLLGSGVAGLAPGTPPGVQLLLAELPMGLAAFTGQMIRGREWGPVLHRPLAPSVIAKLAFLWTFAAVALCLLISLLTAWGFERIGLEEGMNPLAEQVISSQSLTEWLTFTLVTVALAPVFEEVFFRRIVFDGLEAVGAAYPAFLTAILFAVLHGILAHLPALFVLGLILQRCRRECRGLALPIAVHAGFNAVMVLLLGLQSMSMDG